MSKVWGFSVPAGPLQFGTVRWRDRSRFKLLKPGDRVVLVGTMGPPTEERNRGRLLGMMEPTLEPVYSRDYDLQKWKQDYARPKTAKAIAIPMRHEPMGELCRCPKIDSDAVNAPASRSRQNHSEKS